MQQGQATLELLSKADAMFQGMIGVGAEVRGYEYLFILHRVGLS